MPDTANESRRLFARTNAEGTACSETAVCTLHLPCPLADDDGSGPYSEPVDCTDNEALSCQTCGWPTSVCRHCQRTIVQDEEGRWIDPEATGDDSVWRETCDEHDTRTAEHEPEADVRGCSCGMADYGAPGHDGGPPLG